MFSSLQYCPARTSQRYRPRSTNRTSLSRSFAFSQANISSILSRTNNARRRLSFGSIIGNPLVHKFVKPIKIARSRPANQVLFDQLLVIETKAQMRAAETTVLREAYPAV